MREEILALSTSEDLFSEETPNNWTHSWVGILA
jgi:hypothetical protein